jgi:hypothetical protein
MDGVEKRTEVKVSCCVHDMNFHRWQVGPLTVLLSWIVRRKETCASDDSVEYSERYEPSLPPTTLHHQASAWLRILGSAQ